MVRLVSGSVQLYSTQVGLCHSSVWCFPSSINIKACTWMSSKFLLKYSMAWNTCREGGNGWGFSPYNFFFFTIVSAAAMHACISDLQLDKKWFNYYKPDNSNITCSHDWDIVLLVSLFFFKMFRVFFDIQCFSTPHPFTLTLAFFDIQF